jgi:chaperone LolA
MITVPLAVFLTESSAITLGITAQEIIQKVQERYKEIDDAVIKFSQTVKYQVSQIEQTYKGTMYMKKPRKYRIETENQTLVTDGTTSWSYSPRNKQVVIDHYVEDKSAVSPEKLLASYPENFYSSLVGDEKVGVARTYVLKLTPKEDDSFTKAMKVWVDKADWMIRKVEIADVNDTKITYIVKDIVINSGVLDARFRFDIPAGTQAVDLRSAQ